MIRYAGVSALLLLAAPGPAPADPAVIEGATAARAADGTWRFSVTLSHGDTGWDDYADGWRVTDGDGTVYGTRELLHPHVDEQPFTRSLGGVSLPDGARSVVIEARTSTGGWDARPFDLPLPE